MTIHQMGQLSRMEDDIHKRYSERNKDAVMSVDEYAIKMGLAEEGMEISGDEPWMDKCKTVPVTSEIRAKLIETLRRQVADNGNGMGYTKDGNEIGAMFKAYRKNIAPKDRHDVTFTLISIQHEEAGRIDAFIKQQDPNHRAGMPIAKDILDAVRDGSYVNKMQGSFDVST